MTRAVIVYAVISCVVLHKAVRLMCEGDTISA
jgi:hypothetical protein